MHESWGNVVVPVPKLSFHDPPRLEWKRSTGEEEELMSVLGEASLDTAR